MAGDTSERGAQRGTELAPKSRPTVELVRQPHGGALRRGNPGNKGGGRRRSEVAREILEAATPEVAAVLVQMARTGTVGRGSGVRKLSDPDHIKAAVAVLDRGGAPARTEIGGADGAPFSVVLAVAPRIIPPDDA